MEREELIEQLAEKEHGSWSHWMKYLFSKCTANGDGSVTIPPDLVERWKQQAETPYTDLSEREKQSDRNRVKLILPIIEVYQDPFDQQQALRDYKRLIEAGPLEQNDEELRVLVERAYKRGLYFDYDKGKQAYTLVPGQQT